MNAFVPMLRNLLTQIRPEVAQKSSYLNYHAVGMDYLNLYRDPAMTVKLYMIRPKDLQTCGTADYLVNPHDHSYNFHTYVVAGEVFNINFSEGGARIGDFVFPGTRFHAFRYEAGERRFESAGDTTLAGDRRWYGPGQDYYLPHNVVHTIAVPRRAETCLMLIQYTNKLKGPTKFFSLEAEPPKTENLYAVPTLAETQELINRARRFSGRNLLYHSSGSERGLTAGAHS